MKLNSKYFDSIRAEREGEDTPPHSMICAWPGCDACATHPAPLGRGREGQYAFYCLDHVREYNKSYNYFSGMDDNEVAAFQKSAVVGHRPTWRMSGRFSGGIHGAAGKFRKGAASDDPMGAFGAHAEPQRQERTVHNAARRAFRTLDLETDAEPAAIKRRFHELVKRHHPDVNGGDKASEARLRDVIAAYNCLKAAGFC